MVLTSRNYCLSDRITFTATFKLTPGDRPINNWGVLTDGNYNLLTIVNANYYYYFYWTDSVFLNGWLTVSEAANCLTDLGECFSDPDWLTTYMYIAAAWMTKELSNLLTLLVDWQCGVLFIAKEEFFLLDWLFLNGWYNVTASEAVKLMSDWLDEMYNLLTQLLTDINWPSDCLNDSGCLELIDITAILILCLSGYSFLLDLAVGFDGWLNASEAVNIVWLTWWNH